MSTPLEYTNAPGIGDVLTMIYQLEEKLGNPQELKTLKKYVLTHGVDDVSLQMLEDLKKQAAPVKSTGEYQEELEELILSGEYELSDVKDKSLKVYLSNIDIDLDEWRGHIDDWHSHCSGKPFFKNLIRVVSDKRLDDNNLKVIKAISSAYTHLAIEAELNAPASEFFAIVGESLLKCSAIIHGRQKELYPLVVLFLSQLIRVRT